MTAQISADVCEEMISSFERLPSAIGTVVIGTSAGDVHSFGKRILAEMGMSRREYFSRGEYVAEAQLLMQKKYGYDNLWCLSYIGREAEMLGCRKILYADDGTPTVENVAGTGKIIAGRPLYAGVINDIPLVGWSREESRPNSDIEIRDIQFYCHCEHI